MNASDPFSRITATAVSLGDMAARQHRFVDQRVLLTGERDILATENGSRAFADCLRLLIRMVRHLTVDLGGASPHLADEMTALARGQAWDSMPTIERSPVTDFAGFDAILSVGSSGRGDLPWTVVNSNGWAVRVSSRGMDLPASCGQTNPIGALGAACFGAAEVFKRLIQLRPTAGQLHDQLFFSFHSYRPEDDAGPEIGSLKLDFLLVGAGAIGNGIIHLLGALPVSGQVMIVDKQAYAPENWGTCILVERRHVDQAKAKVAQGWLAPKLEVMPYHETIEAFEQRCGAEVSWPRLVVGALDDPGARRSVQNLWPDQIIDGAIGATSCEVTLHPWGPDLSCLKCDFAEAAEDSTKVQREATGLRAERLADMQSVVTQEDVHTASPERRDWLSRQVGRPICSVVSEGVLAFLAGRSQAASFQPSVPFVACLSSCMVVSELMRYATNAPSVLRTGFQFSVLYGPERGLRIDHERKRDCLCVTKRANIETVRQRRGLRNT